MKCLICGKDFVFLGRHIKIHNVTAKNYRVKYNMPIDFPLAEESIIDHMSEMRIESLKDYGYGKKKSRLAVY